MAIDTGGRPLSPHLQVYRLPMAAILSITHRATGVVLSIGTVGLIYWLMALATGPEAFAQAQALFGSLLGKLALLGWSYALLYHLCNGVRHLFWDAGKHLDMAAVDRGGVIMIVVSVALTAALWIAALV